MACRGKRGGYVDHYLILVRVDGIVEAIDLNENDVDREGELLQPQQHQQRSLKKKWQVATSASPLCAYSEKSSAPRHGGGGPREPSTEVSLPGRAPRLLACFTSVNDAQTYLLRNRDLVVAEETLLMKDQLLSNVTWCNSIDSTYLELRLRDGVVTVTGVDDVKSPTAYGAPDFAQEHHTGSVSTGPVMAILRKNKHHAGRLCEDAKVTAWKFSCGNVSVVDLASPSLRRSGGSQPLLAIDQVAESSTAPSSRFPATLDVSISVDGLVVVTTSCSPTNDDDDHHFDVVKWTYACPTEIVRAYRFDSRLAMEKLREIPVAVYEHSVASAADEVVPVPTAAVHPESHVYVNAEKHFLFVAGEVLPRYTVPVETLPKEMKATAKWKVHQTPTSAAARGDTEWPTLCINMTRNSPLPVVVLETPKGSSSHTTTPTGVSFAAAAAAPHAAALEVVQSGSVEREDILVSTPSDIAAAHSEAEAMRHAATADAPQNHLAIPRKSSSAHFFNLDSDDDDDEEEVARSADKNDGCEGGDEEFVGNESHVDTRTLASNTDGALSTSSSVFDSNYEIVRVLGCGATAVVLLCRNTVELVAYAIKVVEVESKLHEDEIFREVRLHAQLRHDNIVHYNSSWKEQRTNRREAQLLQLRQSYQVNDDGLVGMETISDGRGTTTNEDEDYESRSASCRGNDGRSILFIQMEFCSLTLAKFLQQRNRLSRTSAVDRVENIIIALQMVNGLLYLHSKQIVHRDIKPTNIFVDFSDQDGSSLSFQAHRNVDWGGLDDMRASIRVKLGDLGLAKTEGTVDTQPTDFFIRTEEHTVGVGSPMYSSPEQLQGKKCSATEDIFSAGIVFAELYFTPQTVSERQKLLLDARRGVYESSLEEQFGEELGIARGMVAPRPEDRLSLAEVKKRLRTLLRDLVSE